jgi:GT2 family glycosyltransferase
VLFLNPDARIDEASLERLVGIAEKQPRIGAVAPMIREPDGSLDYSLRRDPRLRSTYAQAIFLHRAFPNARWTDEVIRDEAAYVHPWNPEWVSGACVLVRRSVLEQIGGLDDGFFLYCEDIDLCKRIRAAGFDLRFEPEAVAVHVGGASTSRAALLPVLAASRVRFARKHRRRFPALLERVGIAIGALTHVGVTRGGPPARRGYLRAFVQTIRS